jgi:hypothetical protein
MRRATIQVDLPLASARGEYRHPQVILREFCHRHGAVVVDARIAPDTKAWTLEIETCAARLPAFPDFIIARPHK